jgi:putative ABC transport system permease protein
MLRASWKSLMARKLRLFMSAFAVVLGVAFVAGSFIFTDTLGRSFDSIMSGSVGDVIVRPVGTGGGDGRQSTQTVPGSVVASLDGTPGAARVDGTIGQFGTFVVAKSGKLIGGMGAPGIAVNHTGAPAAHGVESATLVGGRWPEKAGEVALDAKTADTGGYFVGDTVTFVSTGAEPRFTATLVGTASFGSGSMVGASLAIFDTHTAQQLFMGGKDAFNDIWVTAAPGTSQSQLRDAVATRLPSGLEAVTGDAAAAEGASQVQQALTYINTFLLVFAGIALVVGAFIIVNTFSILVAQRSRELALLRAIGADQAQVGRSVLFEAFVLGLFGAVGGLGVGLLLAMGIKALFARIGLDLSGSGLVLAPRTVIAAFVVGIGVTLLAAYLPARRAGRVPPVAALREDVIIAEGSLHRRVWFGLGLVVLGAAALLTGLFTDVPKATYVVGGGILGVVLGVAFTSPLLGRPVIALLGALFRRLFGAVGLMAEQNAQRNPRRTAATASALMIGVTLVSMMTVFGASAKASVDKVIQRDFAADYVVSNAIGMPFSAKVTDAVATVDGVATVARFRYAPVELDGERRYVAAVDVAAMAKIRPLPMTDGTFTDLAEGSVLVSAKRAASDHIAIGDTVTVAANGRTIRPKVAGIFDSTPMVGTGFLFSLGGFDKLGMPAEDSYAYVTRAPGADPATVGRALDTALKDQPLVTVKDQAAFAEEQRAPIDQMLYLIDALLGLAVIIAILGIINTLALSVIERTREIGLLRAVGLSRRQLRTMLRLESVVIAVLGAALGVGLGLLFGVALQRSLAGDGIDVLAIPGGQLVVFVAIAAVVGVLAALWPGRRAARLDILRAVTTE